VHITAISQDFLAAAGRFCRAAHEQSDGVREVLFATVGYISRAVFGDNNQNDRCAILAARAWRPALRVQY
jgi:hypothetical protein